ncbi:hypothetical protein [Acinetobacter sp. NCu2D-2]|nr:hypothetical protein [Acinetobacter sp. NCu2D-2]
MMSANEQTHTPAKESNDDKGNQDSFKNSTPVKKPNEQPENPAKEQK